MSDESDDDLVPNVHIFPRKNTIRTQLINVTNTNLTSMDLHNMMHSKIPHQNMGFDQRSLKSFPDLSRQHLHAHSQTGRSSQRSIYNGRCGSPIRSRVRNIGSNASVSVADILFAFKTGQFNKHDLHLIKNGLHKYAEHCIRGRIAKRKNLKSSIRQCKRKSGGETGFERSDSSASSDDCRSSRSVPCKENISRIRPKDLRPHLNKCNRQVGHTEVFKNYTESYKQDSLRELLPVQNRSDNLNSLPYNIQQNEMFNNRYAEEPENLADSNNASVVSLNRCFATDASSYINLSDDVDKNTTAETTHNSTKVSMKPSLLFTYLPSFIKKIFFTQKLDVFENNNLSSDNLGINSPETNKLKINGGHCIRGRIAKRRNLKSSIRQCRRKSDCETGFERSDSSASSDDCRSSRSVPCKENISRIRPKDLRPHLNKCNRQVGHTEVFKNYTESYKQDSLRELLPVQNRSDNLNSLPYNIQQNEMFNNRYAEEPENFADSNNASVVSLNRCFATDASSYINLSDDVDKNTTAETTHNSTKVSMKPSLLFTYLPSFIKKNFFTQKLDVFENNNLSSDNLGINSPETNKLKINGGHCIRGRIAKRRNLKSSIRQCRRKSDGETGFERSDSSASSDDCRSTRPAPCKENISRIRPKDLRPDLNKCNRQVGHTEVFKNYTESYKQDSLRELLPIQNRSGNLNSLPHNIQQNEMFNNRYAEEPENLADSNNASVVSLNRCFATDASSYINLSDDVDKNTTAETTHNSTKVSMKPSLLFTYLPSFIKKIFFTQKLDVFENNNLNSDNLGTNSPKTNKLKINGSKNKVGKLTSQSCLIRDDLKDNNYQDLIVPPEQINITSVGNKKDTNKCECNQDEDVKWDVTSVMSLCKGNEESETCTDEEMFIASQGVKKMDNRVNKDPDPTLTNHNTQRKHGAITTHCKVVVEKLSDSFLLLPNKKGLIKTKRTPCILQIKMKINKRRTRNSTNTLRQSLRLKQKKEAKLNLNNTTSTNATDTDDLKFRLTTARRPEKV